MKRICFGATYWALFLVGDVRSCTGDRGEKKWPSHTLNLNRRAHLLMTTAPSRADLTISWALRCLVGHYWSPWTQTSPPSQSYPCTNCWYWAATEKDVNKTRRRLKSFYTSSAEMDCIVPYMSPYSWYLKAD